jgi:SAM-dependent methyltransferase
MSVSRGEAISDYDVLAEYYNPVYNAGRRGRAGEIALATGLVETYHPTAQSILDLGTGTGVLLKGFEGRIGELVGLDISPEMLKVARHELPEAEFIEADMSNFELNREFDVIMCFFDSINHLQSFEQWESVFKGAEQHLAEDGIFIFDIATSGLVQDCMNREHPNSWPIEGGDYSLETEAIDANHLVSHFTVSLDGANGDEAKIITGDIYETMYPVDQVKTAAAKYLNLLVDFEAVNILVDGINRPATDDSRHPVFIYEKPES